MGDMADFIIDQGMNAWSYDDDDEFPMDKDGVMLVNNQHRCRYCGCGGLHWANTLHGWRLAASTGKIHSCVQYFSSFRRANH